MGATSDPRSPRGRGLAGPALPRGLDCGAPSPQSRAWRRTAGVGDPEANAPNWAPASGRPSGHGSVRCPGERGGPWGAGSCARRREPPRGAGSRSAERGVREGSPGPRGTQTRRRARPFPPLRALSRGHQREPAWGAGALPEPGRRQRPGLCLAQASARPCSRSHDDAECALGLRHTQTCGCVCFNAKSLDYLMLYAPCVYLAMFILLKPALN